MSRSIVRASLVWSGLVWSGVVWSRGSSGCPDGSGSSSPQTHLGAEGPHVHAASLPALAVVHGRGHQEDVCVSVPVQVHRRQLTAEVRADLKERRREETRREVGRTEGRKRRRVEEERRRVGEE